MIIKAFSIYDSKAEAFNQPYFILTDGLASRSFIEACKDKTTNLYKYPNDYSLYCIGSFDDSSAKFDSVIPPKLIMTGSQAFNYNNTQSE